MGCRAKLQCGIGRIMACPETFGKAACNGRSAMEKARSGHTRSGLYLCAPKVWSYSPA